MFEIEGFENLTEKEIEELNIENSRDLTIILKGVRTSENVLRWAISRKGVAKGRMKRGIMGRK